MGSESHRPTVRWRRIRGALVVMLGPWEYSRLLAIGVVMGLRMVVSGWSMLFNREPPTVVEQLAAGAYPDRRLGLPPHPRFAELDAAADVEDRASARYDVRWF